MRKASSGKAVVETKTYTCTCQRLGCGYQWVARNGKVPRMCARCGSRSWQTAEIKKPGRSFSGKTAGGSVSG